VQISPKAVLVHHSLDIAGGAELVAIATIEALSEMGYKVDLITIKKPQLRLLEKIFNASLKIDRNRCLLPTSADYRKSIYFQLVMQLLTIPLTLINKADIIINTQADFPLPYFKRGKTLISYVHFPYVLSKEQVPISSRYSHSIFWRLYFAIYNALIILMKPLLFFTLKNSVVLTNSNFSKKAIRRLVPGVLPLIIRPPVNIGRFANAITSSKRENRVIVIGRITPEKQLERAIEICSLLPITIDLLIVGSADSSDRTAEYLKKLKQMIEAYNLGDRVKILANIRWDELTNLLMTAKVYLHTKSDEHFGISIVEAISAGLIPVVPDSGGPTEFVPRKYRYLTTKQAANLISKYIAASQSERFAISKVADEFSKEYFKSKIKKIIQSVT
jgi:alpha-1,2-mannosyltransferase